MTAIDEYVAHHNVDPKPFIWTKSARDMLQKVIRANSRLRSKKNATLHYLGAMGHSLAPIQMASLLSLIRN